MIKNNKIKINKKIVTLSLLMLLLIILGSTSYAYFTARITGNDTAERVVANAGTMSLEYDGTFITSLENAIPGTSKTINFTVKNTGTLPATYAITMINVVNTFADKEDLVYEIESTNKGGTLYETVAPSKNGKILSPVIIEPGVTQEYTLTLHFKETYDNQNDNQGKTFGGLIQIRDINDVPTIEGEVVNFSEGDYIEIQSNPMTSQIVDGEYRLINVDPGDHTIYIKDESGNIKGEKNISLEFGSENTISEDGSRIIFTRGNQTAKMNINMSDGNMSLVGKEVVDNPLTLTENTILYTKISDTDPDFTRPTPYDIHDSINENATYSTELYSTVAGDKTIGSDYTFNEETGKYTLLNAEQKQSYNSSAVGKYTCNSSSDSCTTMYKIEEVNEITGDELFYEAIDNYTDDNYTISKPVTVGTSYSFNSKTGRYTLNNYEQNVTLSDAYVNYYVCEYNTSECDEMIHIKRIEGNTLLEEDYYYSNSYYRQIINKDYSTNSTSNANKVVGTDFTFDRKTGRYTLTDTTANVTYSNDYQNYYTCNNTSTSCATLFKIKSVEDGVLKSADRYTRTNTTRNYVTKATVYKTEKSAVVDKSGLFTAEDEKGISYYYRGSVTNNYVSFAGILWRIVRINGDGTVRLITQDAVESSVYNSLSNDIKYGGYTYLDENGQETNSVIKENVDNWYRNTINNYDNAIVEGDYCNDTSQKNENGIIYFGASDRAKNKKATLKCNTGLYHLKVGLLSADEVLLAGYTEYGDEPYINTSNYLYNSYTWMTMSPSKFEKNKVSNYAVSPRYIQATSPTYSARYRPVINIKNNLSTIRGDGSVNNPYVIDTSALDTTLSSEIMKNEIITDTSLIDYANGEPRIATFKERRQSKSMSIPTVKVAVSKEYEFRESDGLYSLVNPTSVDLSEEYIGYYYKYPSDDTMYLLTGKTSSGFSTYIYGKEANTYTANNGLYQGIDDDGTTYYYRGAVVNNYVIFANKKWRITRVNGDGSIRLLLDSSIGTSPFRVAEVDNKYAGYTYDNNHMCTKDNPCISDYGSKTNKFINEGTEKANESVIKSFLENWYINNLSEYNNQIALATFCNDTTGGSTTYGPAGRLNYSSVRPTLLCNDTDKDYGGNYKLKIGLLSADEFSMAGVGSYNYYRNPDRRAPKSYLVNANTWTMSPAYNDSSYGTSIFMISSNDAGNDIGGANIKDVRPVINLKSDIKIMGGNGTSKYPYVIVD